MTTQHTNPSETDADTEAHERADHIEELADQLSRLYDFLPLAEVETADPDRAQEHWDAAHDLRAWLRGLPKQAEREAFQRGWDRAMDRAKRRIDDLETVIASERQDNKHPPTVAADWYSARQDPRYALVRRELVRLDTVDGTMVIPRPLQELLALRVTAALLAAEDSQRRAEPTT